MSATDTDFDRQIDTNLALDRYLNATEEFARVSREFEEACEQVRLCLAKPMRFLTQLNYRHYLVTSDGQGNFEVEQLESL